jgi:hypothetical protein
MSTPPGTSTFDPPSFGLFIPPSPVIVARYHSEDEIDEDENLDQFEILPNIYLISDQWREGPEPAVARYRYSFDQTFPDYFPHRVEDIFATAVGPYVVRPDDRIVSLMILGNGLYKVLNDGFAMAAQASVSDDGEHVTFECVESTIREFDSVLEGAIYRHADKYDDPDFADGKNRNDVRTILPVRFNPDGRPNAVPEDGESVMPQDAELDPSEQRKYPVFLDEKVIRDPDIRRHWSLGMAFRYLCSRIKDDGKYIVLPFDFMSVDDDTFVNLKPTTDGGIIDIDDPSTYTKEPIFCPDVDVTGMTWLDAIMRLIEPFGFGIKIEQAEDENLNPKHYLIVYRKDLNYWVKSLYHQKPNEFAPVVLDMAQTNATRIDFQQDHGDIVNEIVVRPERSRREVSVILAPLFEIDADDATGANPQKFNRANEAFTQADNFTRYRIYGVDEVGEGHWDWDSSAIVTDVPDLDAIFRQDGSDNDPVNDPSYVRRRMPAVQKDLFYRDVTGKPIPAELWYSFDYDGIVPGVWDKQSNGGTGGTWQKVGAGGWKLDDGRLGVIITTPDVTSVPTGGPGPVGRPNPKGALNIVKCLANPDAGANKRFHFRLTCVIDSDRAMDLTATRRPVTPTKYTIRRVDDAEDRYKQHIPTPSSHYNTTDKFIFIDDSVSGKDYAQSRRRAHELGRFGGAITIPYIDSGSYTIGDKIDMIRGKDLDLNQLAGTGTNETPIYPAIVGRDRSYEPRQTTTYHLNDLRLEGVVPPSLNKAGLVRDAKRAIGPADVADGGDIGDV